MRELYQHVVPANTSSLRTQGPIRRGPSFWPVADTCRNPKAGGYGPLRSQGRRSLGAKLYSAPAAGAARTPRPLVLTGWPTPAVAQKPVTMGPCVRRDDDGWVPNLLRLRRGHRAHRIAFAQQRAGAGDHHVAL